MKKIFFIIALGYCGMVLPSTLNLHYCVYLPIKTVEIHNYFFNYGSFSGYIHADPNYPKNFTLTVPNNTDGYYCSDKVVSLYREGTDTGRFDLPISMYGDKGAIGNAGGFATLHFDAEWDAQNRTNNVAICSRPVLCHNGSGDYKIATRIDMHNLYIILFTDR